MLCENESMQFLHNVQKFLQKKFFSAPSHEPRKTELNKLSNIESFSFVVYITLRKSNYQQNIQISWFLFVSVFTFVKKRLL